MTAPIKFPARPISQALQDLINEHNYRVEQIWMLRGSNCKPFTPSNQSTVPATAVQSRVLVDEHGGSSIEVRS